MKFFALFPFGYSVFTRFNTPRDFAYLVATQWLPGIWLVYRLSENDLLDSIVVYAIGYLTFIAIYELGYFLNDTWDAKRLAGFRNRLPFAVGPGYAAVFFLLRISLWVAISIHFELITSLYWLSAYSALAIVFLIHNVLEQPHFRIASFVQLAYLRFTIPILFGIGIEDFLLLFFICSIFYVHFRSLAYLDSKEFLQMPERRNRDFGMVQTAIFAPIVIMVYLIMPRPVLLELLVYFAAFYTIYFLADRNRHG